MSIVFAFFKSCIYNRRHCTLPDLRTFHTFSRIFIICFHVSFIFIKLKILMIHFCSCTKVAIDVVCMLTKFSISCHWDIVCWFNAEDLGKLGKEPSGFHLKKKISNCQVLIKNVLMSPDSPYLCYCHLP